MAPLPELGGEIARRMPGQRRIGHSHAFALVAMARGTSGQRARRVAGVIEFRGGGRLCRRRDGRPRWHRGVVDGDRSALATVEIAGDVCHPGIDATAVGKGEQLALDIAFVQSGEPRSEAAVALSAQPVAGEAGIGRAGPAAAHGDKLARGSEAIHGHRLHRTAARQRRRTRGHPQELAARHLWWGTGPSSHRFLPGGPSARRVGNRVHPAARIVLPLALAMSGCKPPPDAETPTALASVTRGKAAMERVGCAACHTIDGIAWPEGKTAPALTGFDRRALIAGRLPNRPEVLAAFVRDAPALVPGTTMPKMPLDEREALDVAAYLYAIGR
jgi:mono/diheme cytochrome c family protein